MEIDGNTVILITIILFLFFSSPSGDGVSSQYEFNQLQTLKNQFQYEFNVFQEQTYDTNFKNITGLKLSYQDVVNNPKIQATYPIKHKSYDSWSPNQVYMLLPDQVIDQITSDVWNMTSPSEGQMNLFPPNITSAPLGKVDLIFNNRYDRIRMPIPRFYERPRDFSDTVPPSGETYDIDPNHYGEVHNVTFETGSLKLKISHVDRVSNSFNSRRSFLFNTQSSYWKLLDIKIDFHDKLEKEKHSLDAIAIYDVKRGRIMAVSNSAKFHGIFALPHYLSLGNFSDKEREEIFNESKKLITEYWNASNVVDTLTIGYLDNAYNDADYKCEFLVFLQLDPWDQYSKEEIKMIDDELNWPLGRPVHFSDIPPVTVRSGLMYSPDCAVCLGMNDVSGPRYEVKIRTIRLHLLFGIALFLIQIYLLLLQMRHTNTPSMVNKISFYCFSMINLVDGSLATLYFVSSTIVQELYLPLVVSAFASFILASIFETRYLISIYASQINEQGVNLVTLLRGNGNEDNEGRDRPIVIPDEASISGTLYGRFAFALIVFTFVLLSSTSWPRHIRTVFEYTTIAILNSYWVPQIFRNMVKGLPSRRERRRNRGLVGRRQVKMPLLWKFIIGTTIIRTIPIIYVFTYSSNVFRHPRDTRFAILLSLWLLFQIAILYSQDILGSRWFLLRNTIPEGYSYFKPVSLQYIKEHKASKGQSYEDSESGSPISTVDCAICMSDIDLNVDELPETHNIDIHTYMVTPCNHIFHTNCLESWMSYKLQCPVCRAPLPPI